MSATRHRKPKHVTPQRLTVRPHAASNLTAMVAATGSPELNSALLLAGGVSILAAGAFAAFKFNSSNTTDNTEAATPAAITAAEAAAPTPKDAVLVFGASGKTGREVVATLLRAGRDVIAACRDADRVRPSHLPLSRRCTRRLLPALSNIHTTAGMWALSLLILSGYAALGNDKRTASCMNGAEDEPCLLATSTPNRAAVHTHQPTRLPKTGQSTCAVYTPCADDALARWGVSCGWLPAAGDGAGDAAG